MNFRRLSSIAEYHQQKDDKKHQETAVSSGLKKECILKTE